MILLLISAIKKYYKNNVLKEIPPVPHTNIHALFYCKTLLFVIKRTLHATVPLLHALPQDCDSSRRILSDTSVPSVVFVEGSAACMHDSKLIESVATIVMKS